MEISANFAFLKQEFPHVAEGAGYAEQHVYGDPRASCFHARHALESLVKRIYKVDKRLAPPKVQNLDSYLSGPEFREIVGETVWNKAEFVRRAGNDAVHGKKIPPPEKALAVVEEFFHVAYWAGRTYLRQGAEALQGKTYDESLLQTMSLVATPVSVEQLEAAQKERDEAEEALKETEEELAKARDELAQVIAANAAVPDTHDWSEEKTRQRIIDLDLKRAGWLLEDDRDREYEVTGMPNAKGVGYADYVLWGDDGKPLAVVEAKRTTEDPRKGQQQAKLYADCLEAMHDQRPVIFYTNGYETWLWDDLEYPPREVGGFYKKDELDTLVRRRALRKALDVADINDEIVERYYQKRAIGSIGERFAGQRRRALLVMATGTGKTRTAIALVDILQRAGWVKRALFLADRVALVNQAVAAFKAHLPESSPVNLVTEKDQSGRVYVSTYPTMMGLIDETAGGEARFGVGHFDLIVIDEAHRSVYQKYGAIFRYFDGLLVGLTATPREQVDRNTYTLFNLEPGVPTDAYELERAVKDEYLVAPKAQQVNLRFPREGIDYDSLSEEEKARWESIDWGDDVDPDDLPDRVNASAINSWFFNEDTVDKALAHLMQNGHKVDGGDRLGKTIIFARNHDHAMFIEERFNTHYPHYAGHFARVIDNYAKYPQSLLDDFSQPDKAPHIAISVDMLDTGIDVPEIVNLVFFKPVYSKIKFWQMIGRGTRLRPDLFAPGHDKQDFRIFDFCFNFDFFREQPDGIDGSGAVPLGTRLFRSRVALLHEIQLRPELRTEAALDEALANTLYTEVACMNRENFLVREKLSAVNRFQSRSAWRTLSDRDVRTLEDDVALLPSELELDDLESRQFDLRALQMQIALAGGELAQLERSRVSVQKLAAQLMEKSAIPAVAEQMEYLADLQDDTFWEGINLDWLEDMRLRLRGLMPFLDKHERKVVYTDFEDDVMSVHDETVVELPSMTSPVYERKVREFLENHQDHLVIRRLRANEALTPTDLEGLEQALVEIGEGEGESLLQGLLEQREAPSLAYFIRTMVGLDRSAAQSAFSRFLSDRSLTTAQIRFVEMVIDQLTARGVMEDSALYEAPFSAIHTGGPDALFVGKEDVIEGIFETLRSASAGLRG